MRDRNAGCSPDVAGEPGAVERVGTPPGVAIGLAELVVRSVDGDLRARIRCGSGALAVAVGRARVVFFLGLIGLVLGLFPFALAFFFGLACGIGCALGALGCRARGLFCDLALELGAGSGFLLGPPLRFDLGDELADVAFDIVEEFLLCRLRVVELGAGRFEFLLARARLGLALLERVPRAPSSSLATVSSSRRSKSSSAAAAPYFERVPTSCRLEASSIGNGPPLDAPT